MDCAEIADEIEANNQKVAGLVSEKGPKTTFSAMWFGMDWGIQDNEITALQSRRQYLVTLAEQRRCGVAALRMTLPADESFNDTTEPASAFISLLPFFHPTFGGSTPMAVRPE